MKKKRGGRLKPARLFFVALIGAGLTYLAVLAWDSQPFKLRRVEIAGNTRIPKEELAAASGLQRGSHLLKISTTDVALRVEEVPWVYRAKVERIIPSKIRITITEREPAAQVIVPAGTFLADEAGVLLNSPSTGDFPKPALVIADLPTRAAAPGDRIALEAFDQSLKIFSSLQQDVKGRVKVFRAASVDRITIELDGGPTIVFGAAEDLEDKNYSIRSLLDEAKKTGKGLVRIDVRVATRPAVVSR